MSHRAEEKERRRQERLEAEQAAKKSADRKKRLGLVGAVALVAAVAVFVVFAVAGGGGDGDSGGDGAGRSAAGTADIPAQKIDNLAEATRAAQCKVTESEIEGRGHTGEAVTYKTNPPTSGDHDPTPLEDGFYEDPPDVEQSVHSLEHGRINIQYKAGTSAEQIAQLETVADEEVKGTQAYHTLVFPNQTKMEPAVAATAWGQSLTCPTMNDQVFDAIRAFRRSFVDKGPEFIP